MYSLHGISVSKGIAIAPACIFFSDTNMVIPRYYLKTHTIEEEILRLQNAMQKVKTEALKIYKNQSNKIAKNIVEIHTLILEDTELVEKITHTIEKKFYNAEWAVKIITKEYMQKLITTENEYFQQRIHDINDVALHIIDKLRKHNNHIKDTLESPKIIIADVLLPMQFLRFSKKNIAGIILERGGKTTHVSIIAKALNIPMIINVENINKILPDQNLILDANNGKVLLDADNNTIKMFEEENEKKIKERFSQEKKARSLKHCTKDNQIITFQVNIDMPEELDCYAIKYADGIGLFRTEFIFSTIDSLKNNEEEQYKIYSKLFKYMKDKPVTIRTFDFGGEKNSEEISATIIRENNPLLGARGMRFYLKNEGLFLSQLRALLRISFIGELHILIPMISTLEEVHMVKKYLEIAEKQIVKKGILEKPHYKLGIMIEVPSLLYQLKEISQICDFWSIGTNDLLQYMMAIDRSNTDIDYLFSYLQPSFLKVLQKIFYEGYCYKTKVVMCGEMASDIYTIPLLLGAGLRNFSVSLPNLAEVISIATACNTRNTRELFERAVTCTSIEEVQKEVKEFINTLPIYK